jgi:integrase
LVSEYAASAAVGDERNAAQTKVLRRLEESVAPSPLPDVDALLLQTFLASRLAAEASPNTVRKERGMINAFYTWAWRQGHVSAETLLAVRSVPVPAGSTGVARPRPYKRWEIRDLWGVLDERWPSLPADEAARWLSRWQDGRSPYARVRAHAIHVQLAAMVTLALSCGLRRGEIYACGVDDFHPDNDYIPVSRSDGTVREVPLTGKAREAIAEWLVFRAVVDPPHDRAWLNLWAEPTVKQPMTEHAFEKVLATYLGKGWTFRRLRDTCAVEWLRAGLPVWSLQELLGHRSMKDTLPYLEAAGSDAGRDLHRVERRLSAPPV